MSPRLTHVAIPTIETERLFLRVPRVEDFAGYASIVTSERGRFVGGPVDEATAWLDYSQMVAGWVLRGFGALSIEGKENRDYLGTVVAHHEYGDPEPELGWLLTTAAEGQSKRIGSPMFNWLQYYSLEALERELAECGFRVVEHYADVAGTPKADDNDVIAVVAQKI